MDSDYNWFLENYDQLFQKYGECYLVIKNKVVLGKFSSYGEGVRGALKTEEPGTFIVQHCNGNESGYTNYIASLFNIVSPGAAS